MAAASSPDLERAYAAWLDRRTLVWAACALPPGLDPATLDWSLHWSRNGGIDPWAPEPVAWESAPLGVATSLAPGLAARFPAASGVVLEAPRTLDVEGIVRGQAVVLARMRSGRLVNASGVQLAGVLDDLYGDAVRAALGPSFADGRPTLRVWAPTAHRTSVLLWAADSDAEAEPTEVALGREPDGCWAATLDPSWVGCRYLFSVTLFVSGFGRVVTNHVTDPYSVALTENSAFSVLVDLDDPALAPGQWATAVAPTLASPVDQVIYELHVREFSRADKSIPEALRGTYLAFAEDGHGTRHLAALAAAGLNTVQLLPIFDFTSAEENPHRRPRQDADRLRAYAPDSEHQQRYVRETGRRAFNWGYDPWHYLAPEGSYASASGIEGGARVREVRTMIGALHACGLRVVVDQVYNHTTAAGQSAGSVLGRIVPGYYHRLDESGRVYTSTCCPNVATEHLMAEKLMVEACVHWARRYRVDGFRFDLMGHHSRANLLAVRAALDELTLDADGVDGRAITMYGEGWNFGEVADGARFVQAAQGRLGGTHIATFNDRLRDAVRGGAPFDADPRLQGFGSGLFTAPNACLGNGTPAEQRARLLHDADLIQVGLTGGLRRARFRSQVTGSPLAGEDVAYHGRPAGYADAPDEVINYVDAHDNETLFDALTLKLPIATSMADRVRANTLCLAFATLGQAPVLWHAGTDFLRSKSLDRNSYDSGDWFNYLDFTLTDNGFGAGLPPAADNAGAWPYLRPLLARAELKPRPGDMRRAHEASLDLLRLRASSRLFRLGDPDAVLAKVSFPASGTWMQTPGVVWMLLDDAAGEPVDALFSRIAVVFNASAWPVRQRTGGIGHGPWELHPVQASGSDPVVRASFADGDAFGVPGRTVAVYVQRRFAPAPLE